MATRFECTICEGKVGIGHDICGKCAKQFYELYGDNWKQLDWVKALTQNKHYMEKLEREEQIGWEDIGTSYTSNHFYLREEDSYADITGRHVIDTGTGNHFVVRKANKKTHKYDSDISMYVRQGLGYRRIHKKLVEKYGAENVPSDRTVFVRTQQFRGK